MVFLLLAGYRGGASGKLLVLILAVLSLLEYRFLVHPLFHGRLSHIPGPWLSKIPSLNLALYDLRVCRNDQILKWHRRYGPIVCIAPNEISVTTRAATREIYGSSNKWAKSNYFDNFTGYNEERSVFATKPYEEHREKRRLTSTFYQASTIYKLPEIEKRIQDRIQAVVAQISPGKDVDIYNLTSWYVLDNITYLILGPKYGTQSVEQPCLERKILQELKHLQFFGPIRTHFSTIFTHISSILGRVYPCLSYLQADRKLEEWFQGRLCATINDPALYTFHSLLRCLVQIHKNGGSKPLDYKFIAVEGLDNINAAVTTVAVTVTYLVWQLIQHPKWQQRIHEELRTLSMQTDGLVCFNDVNTQASVLEACLREVYRFHPPSSGRAERVVPDGGCNLLGFYLPGETVVTTSVVGLHQNEIIFPEPEEFRPERWLEGDELSLKVRDAQLIPFGYGGRVCPGKPLATMEIKMLIAAPYLRYKTTMTAFSSAESMKQSSTFDAVPKALKCIIAFSGRK
ncbi:MAG: hypothetical protein M1834_009549 [Cirrosporium novae-zelandiae]|nr:MAG: hypothetical protein M1834_009549 [Cirrosporium novae-zelandiae]